MDAEVEEQGSSSSPKGVPREWRGLVDGPEDELYLGNKGARGLSFVPKEGEPGLQEG